MKHPISALTSALLAILLFITSCSGNGNPSFQPTRPELLGPFLFMVGQTSDTLFIFKEADSGALSLVASPATGHTPVSIAVQGTAIFQPTLFVLNAADNTVSAVNLDPRTGIATPAGSPAMTGSNPVAMGIRNGVGIVSSTVSDFGTLYVLNQGSNSISGLHVTGLQGNLAAVPGSPFTTQANPQSIAVVANGGLFSDPNFVYVANGTLGSISAFKVNSDDSLTELTGSPFAAGTNIVFVAGRGTERILMASDAGANKLLAFKIANDGTLTPFPGSPFAVGAQPGPIAFTSFSNTFVYIANRGSNNISAFKVDTTAFTLTPVSGSPFNVGTNPVSVGVVNSLGRLFVANQGSADINGFRSDDTTGVLTPLTGFPMHVVTPPSGLQTFFAEQAH